MGDSIAAIPWWNPLGRMKAVRAIERGLRDFNDLLDETLAQLPTLDGSELEREASGEFPLHRHPSEPF